jgi:hypothetical protein
MNAVWPQVVDWKLAKLPTLAGWGDVAVYDGPVTDVAFPPSFVTVGFVTDEDTAGTGEPGEQFGDIEVEVGTVRSELVCQTGEDDMPGMRAQAFGLVNALKAEIRRDVTLGDLVAAATLAWDVLPVQNDSGSAVRLALTLGYTARGV